MLAAIMVLAWAMTGLANHDAGQIVPDECRSLADQQRFLQGYERHKVYLKDYWLMYQGTCQNFEQILERLSEEPVLSGCYHKGKAFAGIEFTEKITERCVPPCINVGKRLSEIGAAFTCHTFPVLPQEMHAPDPEDNWLPPPPLDAPIRICNLTGQTECRNAFDLALAQIQESGHQYGFGHSFFWENESVAEETRDCGPSRRAIDHIKNHLCHSVHLEHLHDAILREDSHGGGLTPEPPIPELPTIFTSHKKSAVRYVLHGSLPVPWINVLRATVEPNLDDDNSLVPLPIDEDFSPPVVIDSMAYEMKTVLPDYYDWW